MSEQNQIRKQITEDEASLYDRQIRLWGLEAQNRMRSSTVLILSLRSLAHETIKNLVLAGVGRLIVADSDVVTEEDLGSGFLFREEDNAVGKLRTDAALEQIQSLNPLVTLSKMGMDSFEGEEDKIAETLKKEAVDVVVTCDLSVKENERIDAAARKASSLFYAAGTYGFTGYVFADLGESYEYVVNSTDGLSKKILSYPSFSTVLDRSNWAKPGGSPFRGLSRNATKSAAPATILGITALWEYESQNGHLPSESPLSALISTAESIRTALGVNSTAVPSVDSSLLAHLASHATHFFPPTLAILGGLLAQDVLRALSRKDKPVANLLAVDSMSGVGTVGRWSMIDAKDAQ
ncbi:SUMO activating enzyme [Cryptococcus neoformans C23]|uniref:Ubiquitin-like 1-activating enzyme E1A n=2 Tax=Cryptococcus neoformans TaxID=5207 RepID=A0A854Q1X6_CRYNE|nr:SUMO activating enzyme [Cryptococcus neoformans var. grubii H99]AUB28749.1 SUMO activating enzyme [Cryptococcus neoformans var. grubii]OWZ26907.1 SUMO activating enzyme [Cryptococcus neoformans var. grubii AD2-60a]OWZ28019.1 SUMO activating enzyme [Cryptococcus neoformans var. grubii AD1-83a]OWZ38768.1 SUMO activating enzyme [Cryptococcus neoformans var. grubii C23]OWZ50241.1 SUMO activating enzyme [Cryptococcus neoformans var. grubii 125.91]OXG10723.1 SUMO activating enzyme [Cryptococcus |eukprot:XP_012053299.1 SUMO activating enzyme [Cryptococcus neoformans var. grubii H99]